MVRPALRAVVKARSCLPTSRPRIVRFNHTVAELELQRGDGIPGLFSPKGVEIAWFNYQKHLIDNLNTELDDAEEYKDTHTIYEVMMQSLSSGTDLKNRKIAHYASQAYNNEFFFRSLRASANARAVISPEPTTDAEEMSSEVLNAPEDPQEMSAALSYTRDSLSVRTRINESFDSVLTLRELIVNRADAMFGNGNVWLIYHNPSLSLVNTYNSASIQSSGSPTDSGTDFAELVNVQNKVSSFQPILCLNAWEHVYLHDYGVTGKRRYLRNLFDCIDWDMAKQRLTSSKVDHQAASGATLRLY